MTTAAIYARKSKATDKGESTENQINRGISLCKLRGWDYVVYEDYDVSGKNLDRPEFKRMLNDAHEGKVSNIVCYKLDRISRSVNDFSNLIEELNSIDVGFVCIKDNFDTSTPMGRAMMYITSVFAQLERETIAERVKDNMVDRAKMGKWNGGPVPYGFDTEKKKVQYKGKDKKVSKLIIDHGQAAIIKEFYQWYLESDGSIRNNVVRANEKGYRTSNNAYWSHNQMSRLLQNPLYCIADGNAYTYFKNSTEVDIVNDKEEYNGEHGLMFYNRRKQHKKTSKQRDEQDWILTIGEHKGFIPGEIFTKVQRKLNLNKNKAPRQGQSERSPLVGLIKCGRCGSSMSVFAAPKTTGDGNKKYYYYFRCLTREQKSKTLCDNKNIRADILESQVIEYINKIGENEEVINEIFEKANNKIDDNRIPLIAKRNELQKQVDEIETKIDNLVDALGSDTLPSSIIKKRYKKLEEEKQKLIKEISSITFELDNNTQENINLDKVKEYLLDFRNTYEYLDVDEKRKMLQSIIKEIKIDREKVFMKLYFDIQDEDGQAFCLRKDMDSYLQQA